MLPDRRLAGDIAAVREILTEKLFVEVDSADSDLLQAGLIDSLALIQMLVHLEEKFGVKISLDELEIEDLRSVNSIARLVAKLRDAGTGETKGTRASQNTAVSLHS